MDDDLRWVSNICSKSVKYKMDNGRWLSNICLKITWIQNS